MQLNWKKVAESKTAAIVEKIEQLPKVNSSHGLPTYCLFGATRLLQGGLSVFLKQNATDKEKTAANADIALALLEIERNGYLIDKRTLGTWTENTFKSGPSYPESMVYETRKIGPHNHALAPL